MIPNHVGTKHLMTGSFESFKKFPTAAPLPTPRPQTKWEIKTEEGVAQSRMAMRAMAKQLGFRIVEETKLVTVVSELTRNMLVYGGGGTAEFETVSTALGVGIRATFTDQGPGIPDIDKALTDGFSTGNSLGLGLPGSKRMMHDFQIQSEVGKGTKIVVTHWKR
jgi:serine/threonine-protein kinase RsbT